MEVKPIKLVESRLHLHKSQGIGGRHGDVYLSRLIVTYMPIFHNVSR